MVFIAVVCFLHSILMLNRKKSLDTLRAKKIFIRKVKDGPYLGLSYKSLITDRIRSVKGNQRKILKIGKINKAVVSKTDESRKITQIF